MYNAITSVISRPEIDTVAALLCLCELLSDTSLLKASGANRGVATARPPPSPWDAAWGRLTKHVALCRESGQPQTSEFHVLRPDVRMRQEIGLVVRRS